MFSEQELCFSLGLCVPRHVADGPPEGAQRAAQKQEFGPVGPRDFPAAAAPVTTTADLVRGELL